MAIKASGSTQRFNPAAFVAYGLGAVLAGYFLGAGVIGMAIGGLAGAGLSLLLLLALAGRGAGATRLVLAGVALLLWGSPRLDSERADWADLGWAAVVMAVVAFLASVALKTPVTTKSSSLTAAAGGVSVAPPVGVKAVWAERAEAESETSKAGGRRSERRRESVSMGCAMGLNTDGNFRSVVKSDH